MGVLPSLLSLLLVAAAGAVRAAAAVGVNEAYYSSVSELKAYWQTALPNSPMPSAILEHLSAHADGEKVTLQQDALTFQWGQHKKGDVSTFQRGPCNVKGDQKVTFRWGPQKELADEKVTFRWGPDMKEDDEKVTLRWGQRKVGDEKITFQWGPQKEADDGKVTFPKGTHIKDDDKKHIVGRSPKRELADEKTTYRWDPNIKEDDEKVSLQWGQHNVVDEKVTFRWGPNMKEDYDKVTLKWCQHKVGDEKVTFWWGPNMKEDDEKAILRWGEHKVGDEKATFRWGSNMKEDDDKVTFGWGSHKREDGGNTEKFPSFHKDPYVKEKHHQVHGADHTHGQFNLANLLFSESVLAPGTVVTPYIEPSVMPTPFLRRDVAGSIPMSTKNFTNILSMFAPMSLAMAGKIWSTLHTCEHPHPLDSEQQACATSIESMVELAASVLGTRDIRAFSSSLDVPAEGVAPPSSRHVVAAVQAVTGPGEEATTMTCHGATFPYAVFYCHAVNPTRVYEVTLRKTEEDGTAAAAGPDATTMLVLAVCHLDTSQFDPENPFFVERGLKPGDASVCHFLSRDSVLWAPAASTQGYEQVVAQ